MFCEVELVTRKKKFYTIIQVSNWKCDVILHNSILYLESSEQLEQHVMIWEIFPKPEILIAWKVFKYGVFSGPYFPAFGQEKTPHLDTFYVRLVRQLDIVFGIMPNDQISLRNRKKVQYYTSDFRIKIVSWLKEKSFMINGSNISIWKRKVTVHSI